MQYFQTFFLKMLRLKTLCVAQYKVHGFKMFTALQVSFQ